MKFVGGPMDGHSFSPASQGMTPELKEKLEESKLEGVICECDFTNRGQFSINVRDPATGPPRPSFQGLIATYVGRNGVWQFIPPESSNVYASPPIVIE